MKCTIHFFHFHFYFSSAGKDFRIIHPLVSNFVATYIGNSFWIKTLFIVLLTRGHKGYLPDLRIISWEVFIPYLLQNAFNYILTRSHEKKKNVMSGQLGQGRQVLPVGVWCVVEGRTDGRGCAGLRPPSFEWFMWGGRKKGSDRSSKTRRIRRRTENVKKKTITVTYSMIVYLLAYCVHTRRRIAYFTVCHLRSVTWPLDNYLTN